MQDKKTIIFIVGSGRSGSTLLDRTLGHHSQGFSIGEIINFHLDVGRNSLCGCGTELNQCKFWGKFIEQMNDKYAIDIRSNTDAFSLHINEYRKGFAKIYYQIRNSILLFFKVPLSLYYKKPWITRTKEIYDFVFANTNASFLVDSSKSLTRVLYLSRLLKNQYKIKVIHLHRDGRGVLHSELKTTFDIIAPKNSGGGYKKITVQETQKRKEAEMIISNWVKLNKKILFLKQIFFRSNFVSFKFEEFLNLPEKKLSELLKFIGLPYEKEMLEFKYGDNHMVCGNSSRINALAIRADRAKWKGDLNSSELELFQQKAGKLNSKLTKMG